MRIASPKTLAGNLRRGVAVIFEGKPHVVTSSRVLTPHLVTLRLKQHGNAKGSKVIKTVRRFVSTPMRLHRSG